MPRSGLPTIALAQMEVKPGLPDRNAARMVELIGAAREGGAEIVVFSELCISGYIIGDLWELDTLVQDFAAYSDDIRAASQDITVVFGNVVVDADRVGEDGRMRKYNAVIVCSNGEYVTRAEVPAALPNGVHAKTLHANYRFFDDGRHFFSLRQLAESCGRDVYEWCVPFCVRRRDGTDFRFGVQLCEDMWCQDYSHNGEVLDTLRAYARNGAEAVFNLSASPWTWQKNDKRNRVVREILRSSPLPFFYVNQVGAQNNGKNIIVFDGDTTVYSPTGEILRRARPWKEEMVFTGGIGGGPDGSTIPAAVTSPNDRASATTEGRDAGVALGQREIEAVYDAILTGLRHMDHFRGGEENRFLIGVSGGIDSTVVACLLERAFGADRVFAVNMPTRFNATVTRENAKETCRRLEVDYLSCPIEDLYQQVSQRIKEVEFPRSKGTYDRLVDENIQARIRFSDMLAGIAAKHGLVFTNNGNKTELALGYTTLYGDLDGAIAPIADLYKVQVYELGRYLNEEVFGEEVIPGNLLTMETVPSAELSEAQDVTRGLGDPIKYGYHDAVLRQLVEYRRHPADLVRWYLDGELLQQLQWQGEEREREFADYFPDGASFLQDLEWVERQLRISYFKRVQVAPLIVLSKRAFGSDLRETQRPEYSPRIYRQLKERVLRSGTQDIDDGTPQVVENG